MKSKILCLVAILCSTACKNDMSTMHKIDVQGHRGCRGLLPENTIKGFVKALDLGVQTLELDLSVNGDGDVIISHEPFFNHEISTAPDGSLITKEDELSHNVYKLSQAEIETYDVGLRPHPRFPLQKKIAATKPLLKDMVTACEAHAEKKGMPAPLYNMEIKRSPKADNIYHPPMKIFADKVIKTIRTSGVMDRTTVQCFDVETLQYIHEKYSDVQLVYLIENKNSPQKNIDLLGFTPQVYSPYFELVDEHLVDYCDKQKMKLIPWTVNEEKDTERLIGLGVDGIITDYPDMVIEIISSHKKQ